MILSGTYQAYLTRQPQYLVSAIRHAEQNDYALGIKLVRGAYYVQERKKWADENRVGPDPIWPEFVHRPLSTLKLKGSSKPGTDKSYNTSIKTILSTLSSQLSSPKPELALSVVFGTHNHESVGIVINTLEKQGLATTSVADKGKLQMRGDVQGKVSIAQLYGRSRPNLGIRLMSPGTGMKDDLMDLVVQTFEPTGTPVSLKVSQRCGHSKQCELMLC